MNTTSTHAVICPSTLTVWADLMAASTWSWYKTIHKSWKWSTAWFRPWCHCQGEELWSSLVFESWKLKVFLEACHPSCSSPPFVTFTSFSSKQVVKALSKRRMTASIRVPFTWDLQTRYQQWIAFNFPNNLCARFHSGMNWLSSLATNVQNIPVSKQRRASTIFLTPSILVTYSSEHFAEQAHLST